MVKDSLEFIVKREIVQHLKNTNIIIKVAHKKSAR